MGGGGDSIQCCYRENLRYKLYSAWNEPKLYRLAVSGQWDRIPDRCAKYPKEAAFVHKYPPSDTALHRILEVVFLTEEDDDHAMLYELKQHAAHAVYHAHPATLAVANSFGRTPLHLACMDPQSSIEWMTDLISSYPRATCMTDVELRTPLHHWCSILHKIFNSSTNGHDDAAVGESVIILLLEHNPDAVYAKDMTGETPLAIAQRRCAGTTKNGPCSSLPNRIQSLLQPNNKSSNQNV